MIPNMAKLYILGEEVMNSNVASKSLLLKNNWHLPHNQTISLSHLRTRVDFGEVNPFYVAMALGFSQDYNFVGQQPAVYPIQGLNSHIDTKSYKLGYSWQPENSRWIDLQANIWRIRTDSSRHQNGGPELGVTFGDSNYDNWVSCFIRHQVPYRLANLNMSCDELVADGTIPAQEPNDPAPVEGAYRVKSGSEQRTRATRLGADISNRFRLTDNLSMTLSANIQHEKLDENTQITTNDRDFFGIINSLTTATAIAGPRAGRRHEWGGGLVFDWQPTARLNIQAGVRYDKFWAYDDALAKERKAKRNPFYSSDMEGGQSSSGYIIGAELPYYEIIGNKEEADDIRRIVDNSGRDPNTQQRLYDAFRIKYGYDYDHVEGNTRGRDGIVITDRNGENSDSGAVYRLKYAYAPYTNGQYQGPLFRKGQFDERADNPQGLRGSYLKYLNGLATYGRGSLTYLERKDQADQAARNAYSVRKRPATEEEVWPTPKHLKARAWSPLLAVSYDLTDKSRLFFRFAQATRFPSIYEATTTNVNLLDPYNFEFDLKPERSTNWEIGYAFNFAPYSKRLKAGDIRITYYDNTIRNAIDISENKNIVQYEKKQTSGIELQSRIDSGKWFATFGANYRLKQRVCDKTTAWNYDIYNNRIPECIDGGFGATRFYQTMQPKYSLNLDAGTRRLNNRLELGMRGTYHSTVSTKQQDELAAQGLARILEATGRPYHWRASLVFDMYAKYRIGKNFGLNLGITNLTNRYYLDPMSNVPVPAPGRAVTFGFTGKF
ncbi:TonB-dependent receptor domain-containing protein [Kingella potus]|uniref:TonB-dependent receptor domain-containing protein n=1 Tax=Kingella potus TaxID=265175 RepID=UPI001FD51C12|nr:TonB-dependent receptor [Kingella potus]UOP00044.1 TonB-dependent receptor [Kingella potus]